VCLVLTIIVIIGIFHTTFHHSAKYHSTLRLNDFIDRYVSEVSWTPKLNQACNTCVQMSSGGTLQLTRAWCTLARNKDLVDDEAKDALVSAHDKMVLETWWCRDSWTSSMHCIRQSQIQSSEQLCAHCSPWAH
jgi:hypothetical protein